MKTLIEILFLFAVGASTGWVLEVFGRSVRAKKLINPGFLSGPCLPIYGFGTVALHFLSNWELTFIAERAWQIVFFAAFVIVVMTVLELIGGLIFIKGMKIKLWDYSKRRFNFMGIICPRFSLFWGVIGLFYYFLINPWLSVGAGFAPTSLPIILLLGVYYGIFLTDMWLSLKLSIKLRSIATKLKTVINVEELKKDWNENIAKMKMSSFFGFYAKLYSTLNNTKTALRSSKIYQYLEDKMPKKNKTASDVSLDEGEKEEVENCEDDKTSD